MIAGHPRGDRRDWAKSLILRYLLLSDSSSLAIQLRAELGLSVPGGIQR